MPGGQRRTRGCPPLPSDSVGSLVRLDDRLRDAPAVVHLVSVLPSPLADRVSLLAVRAGGLVGHYRLTRAVAGRAPARRTSWPPTESHWPGAARGPRPP